MDGGQGRLRDRVEDGLWPLVQSFLDQNQAAGVAVAVVRDEEAVAAGFGVRDLGTREPVTSETMFHLASVSKPVVATAVVSLATARDGSEPVLDLDAPVTDWIPELTLADGRAAEVTARRLLSHTSGLPDVTDYGWHQPRLDDAALSDFARSLSGWRLQSEPGSTFSYSNAGFELLGLLLSRATGTTFEDAVHKLVLSRLGMHRSTFLRSDVPAGLAASPHVGMPLSVPEGAYPYTRRHAPSSSLHSNLVEMCRWMVAHLEPAGRAPEGLGERWARLDPGLRDLMWEPVMPVGRSRWDEAVALGWSVGHYQGLRALSHSGADPGFESRLVLVPERRTGVVVLANSNTVPMTSLAAAGLDIALADGRDPGTAAEGVAALRGLLPPVVGPVAATLVESGPDAAKATYDRLAALESPEFDVEDDDGFSDAVWGAIELHRTSLVWPLLRLWTDLRPDSSEAWTMTGWAHQVDERPELARPLLRRALALDPDNDEAALLLRDLAPE